MNLDREFSKEEKQMSKKVFQRLTSLVIKEKQIKTTQKFFSYASQNGQDFKK